MGSGTLIISIGGYLSTSLSNFLEDSFQPGLTSWRKDVTVPTVCRGDVVDSGWMACDGFVNYIKAELRPNGADAVKSRYGTATCEISKSCPDLFICLKMNSMVEGAFNPNTKMGLFSRNISNKTT